MTRVVLASLLSGLLLLSPAASIVEAAGPAPQAGQNTPAPPPATNGADEPRRFVVTFQGMKRIRGPVVETAAQLDPDATVTRRQLERAARRLEAIPGVSDARVVYRPTDAGRATVDVQITERSRIPRGFAGWATVGGRGILSDEARIEFANLTSAGEVWTVGYRWTKPRERLVLRLERPLWNLPGVVAFEGLLEHQTYRPPIAGLVLDGTALEGTDLVQRRRRIGMQVADWATGWWRWMGGAAFDSIGGRNYVGLDGGVDLRTAGDRVSLILLTGFWNPLDAGERFGSAMTVLAWRSTTAETPLSFYGEMGVSAVTDHTPLAVWPGSHTSAERGGNLRAHPLRDSDVIAGDVFGRQVIFGSVTSEMFIRNTKFGRLLGAAFIDTGRAWQRLPGLPPSRFHVDFGIGVRLAGSKAGGTIRLDYAVGLRDSRRHLSAGFVKAWPGR